MIDRFENRPPGTGHCNGIHTLPQDVNSTENVCRVLFDLSPSPREIIRGLYLKTDCLCIESGVD